MLLRGYDFIPSTTLQALSLDAWATDARCARIVHRATRLTRGLLGG